MRKLTLALETVEVETFATLPEAREGRGTIGAHGAESGLPCELTYACPTNHCVTIPVTCDTFEPTCSIG